MDDEARKIPPSPYLPHELIVLEILVQLPVKSLLRFRCVCKAWRDTVSGDASFSQAHVRRLRQRNRRPSSLLIAPFIRSVNDDGAFIDEFVTPGLYLWEDNQRKDAAMATLVDDIAWFPVEDGWLASHKFTHCDGLVMLPDSEGTVHVLNPATRRRLTLPWSPNSATARYSGFDGQVKNTFGFGRDPSSGTYKVARFFNRDTSILSTVTCSLGMEVFTIGEDRCWRVTAAAPPYPFIEGRTATFFKGSLVWTVELELFIYHEMDFNDAAEVPRIVRFNLEDESFSVIPTPRWYPTPDYEDSRLAELHGELCMARLNEESVEIWMCDDVDGVNPPRWAQRHVLNFTSCISLVAALGDGIVFQDMLYYISRQISQGSKHMVGMTTLKYRNPDTDTLVEYSRSSFDDVDVIPYIPTLVPI